MTQHLTLWVITHSSVYKTAEKVQDIIDILKLNQ